ncbi:hypothetical protein BK816_06755 [Boudabousia tangfeifanii]|uniref:Phage shock protein PspC N-terminal domain-containing protein n=2 Tax=Boudabousia tangfeifanii TaxID=1912795 RepID=A0A1D9MLH5_9ACTO|nr:hypothetical protein BK816_06755 [Boudabousia tangfeifanii]
MGWDLTLLRILFVLSLIPGFAGALVYLVAWLLLPEGATGRIPAEDLYFKIKHDSNTWIPVGIGILVVLFFAGLVSLNLLPVIFLIGLFVLVLWLWQKSNQGQSPWPPFQAGPSNPNQGPQGPNGYPNQGPQGPGGNPNQGPQGPGGYPYQAPYTPGPAQSFDPEGAGTTSETSNPYRPGYVPTPASPDPSIPDSATGSSDAEPSTAEEPQAEKPQTTESTINHESDSATDQDSASQFHQTKENPMSQQPPYPNSSEGFAYRQSAPQAPQTPWQSRQTPSARFNMLLLAVLSLFYAICIWFGSGNQAEPDKWLLIALCGTIAIVGFALITIGIRGQRAGVLGIVAWIVMPIFVITAGLTGMAVNFETRDLAKTAMEQLAPTDSDTTIFGERKIYVPKDRKVTYKVELNAGDIDWDEVPGQLVLVNYTGTATQNDDDQLSGVNLKATFTNGDIAEADTYPTSTITVRAGKITFLPGNDSTAPTPKQPKEGSMTSPTPEQPKDKVNRPSETTELPLPTPGPKPVPRPEPVKPTPSVDSQPTPSQKVS